MALSLQDILENLHAAEQDCARHEKKYGMLSEHFYELYRNGDLDNNYPNLDYTDWAGAYKVMLQSKKDYFNLVLKKSPFAKKLNYLQDNALVTD